jgi:hypothetical protein
MSVLRLKWPRNEGQTKRMPMLFSPTIGAAITARYWFLWVRCPACRTTNAIDRRTLDRYRDAAVTSLCVPKNSNSDIMVMQSAKDRVGMDTSSSLNWARERRVLYLASDAFAIHYNRRHTRL